MPSRGRAGARRRTPQPDASWLFPSNGRAGSTKRTPRRRCTAVSSISQARVGNDLLVPLGRAKRITAAIVAPKDFSPPIASTGIASLPLSARNAWFRSCPAECGELANPARIAPGCASSAAYCWPRGLAEAAVIGRELDPEPVEIDALATATIRSARSAEGKCQSSGCRRISSPRSDAGQRRIHQHEPRHPLRVLDGEGVADHVADVVGHQHRAIDLERIQTPAMSCPAPSSRSPMPAAPTAPLPRRSGTMTG